MISEKQKGLPGHIKLFSEVKNSRDTLIETGTYLGDGVISAVRSGYNKVVSFEIEPALVQKALQRTSGLSGVVIHPVSSSSKLFRTVVDGLQEPAVFWLDAHYNGKGADSPLLLEVECIAASPYAHCILIDDTRLFKTYGVTEEDIMVLLDNAGRVYRIRYTTVRDRFPGDVMCIELTGESKGV